MYIKIVLILLILVSNRLYSAFEQKDIGAKAIALSSCVASVDDIYSVYYNPAGLNNIDNLQVGFNYYSLFSALEGLDSINFFSFSAAYPVPRLGTIGLSYDSYGFDLYKETSFIITHSFELQKNISLGYNFKILGLKIEGYGSANTIGIDVGIIGNVKDNFAIGFFTRNINNSTIGKSGEELPAAGAVGLSFIPIGGLIINGEINKSVDTPLQLKFGQEFRFIKELSFRTGVQTGNTRYSVGLGVIVKKIYLDYAFLSHATLGGEHIFSVVFNLGEDMRTIYREEPKKKKKKAAAVVEAAPEVEYTGEKININTATVEELQDLPRVGPKTAEKIVEYRNIVGPFKKIEDIMNVKGIGPKTFAKFKHMITVGEGELGPSKQEKPAEKEFDINKAGIKDLTEKGISPLMSVRIINYRDNVGGIKSIDELKNIEGMTPELLEQIKKLIESGKQPEKIEEKKEEKEMPKPGVPKFDINKAGLADFVKIGLSSKSANEIIKYRESKGEIKSIEELKKIPGLTEKEINKIEEAMK